LATLFWLAVALAWMVWKPEIRRSLGAVVKAFLAPPIFVSALLYVMWMTAIVDAADHVGIWHGSMLKDTLFWAAPGAALFFASTRAAEEPGFFRRQFLQAIGLTAVLEFYLNFATMDLLLEILLQPILFLAVGVSIVASWRKDQLPAKRVADAIQLLIVLILFVPPTVHLISDWGTIDSAETLRAFALPVWLTACALPFVFALSLYSAYEQVFVRIALSRDDRQVPWTARLALIMAFNIRPRALLEFAKNGPFELAHAASFRETRRVIADRRSQSRVEEATRKQEADDLVRFAGVKGVGGDGRQLDRREFKETVDALDWLHTMQMGWYRQDGHYRRDLRDFFAMASNRHGLPEEPALTLTVSRSGKSWYAWRSTPSGWVFAIGAAGAPPDAWYFDGPTPPRNYPARDRVWNGGHFEPSPNWPG
jgi:hypothetical protein